MQKISSTLKGILLIFAALTLASGGASAFFHEKPNTQHNEDIP